MFLRSAIHFDQLQTTLKEWTFQWKKEMFLEFIDAIEKFV